MFHKHTHTYMHKGLNNNNERKKFIRLRVGKAWKRLEERYLEMK